MLALAERWLAGEVKAKVRLGRVAFWDTCVPDGVGWAVQVG